MYGNSAHDSKVVNPEEKEKQPNESYLPPCLEKSSNEPNPKNDGIADIYRSVPEIEKYFEIHRHIGKGTFSNVYIATLRSQTGKKDYFALKHIVPISGPKRTASELRCLHQIGGQDNVIGIHTAVRNLDNVIVVMPYFYHDKFHDYFREMDMNEIREYMKHLLIALRRVHEFNIIHRDVKPSNFLYDRKRKRYALVDFGLAHHIDETDTENASGSTDAAAQPDKKDETAEVASSLRRQASNQVNNKDSRRLVLSAKRSINGQLKSPETLECDCFSRAQICNLCMSRRPQVAPRAGTPGFRSPEVLMKHLHQTTSVDVWAAGIIYLSLLTGKYPYFKPKNDMAALVQLMNLLGTKMIIEAAKAIGKNMVTNIECEGQHLDKLCPAQREKYCLPGARMAPLPDSAVHLLRRMLDVNPATRVSAQEALSHPFLTS